MIAGFGHVVQGRASGEERVAREVMLWEDDVLGGIADIAEEAMAPIIEGAAETCAAGEQFEFFANWIEAEIIPYEASRLLAERLLILAPHPDDEVIGCGGVAVQNLREGRKVRVVVATDGAEADTSVADRDAYRTSREEESRRALAMPGVFSGWIAAVTTRIPSSASASQRATPAPPAIRRPRSRGSVQRS